MVSLTFTLKKMKDELKDVFEILPIIIFFIPFSLMFSPLGLIYVLVIKYANYNLVKKHKDFIDKLELDSFVYKNLTIDDCHINKINNADYPIKLRFSNRDAVFSQRSEINVPQKHNTKYNEYLSFLVEANLKTEQVVEQLNLINKEFLNKTFLTNFAFFYLKFDRSKAKPLWIEVPTYKIIIGLPFFHVLYLGIAIQFYFLNIKDRYKDYKYKKKLKELIKETNKGK